jgi:DNA-binding NarL/FixJ family response regulator
MRCAIVDDSPALLDAARVLLEREGIPVVGVASTIAEALALVEREEPDIVLIDIDLGAESGFDLARQLDGNRTAVRSILISTHAEKDFRELIADSPALGFLPKARLSGDAIRALLSDSRET